MNNISFQFEDRKLTGYLLNGPSDVDVWHVGILYALLERGAREPFAEIVVKIHTLSITGWKRHPNFEYSRGKLIDLMDLLLPHIVIPRTKKEVESAYHQNKLFNIIFTTAHDGFNPETYTLVINSADSVEDLVEKIVYGGKFTNKLVQNEILKYLYSTWEEIGERSIPFETLFRKLFIPHQILERNLKLLAEQLKIHRYSDDFGMTMSVFLREKGVSYVDNDFQDINTGNMHVYNMGDTAGGNINKINNTGDNTKNVINTGTVTIDSSFNELRKEIEKEYTGADKGIIQQQVDTLEKEAKENPDKESVLKKILDFAQKFVMHPTILNIITSKIIPLLQEAAKHLPHL